MYIYKETPSVVDSFFTVENLSANFIFFSTALIVSFKLSALGSNSQIFYLVHDNCETLVKCDLNLMARVTVCVCF